ncbi:amidohydrolase [Phenylobacterium sp.]|uniref:amidohydrolase n=1 Tax=Phenylobacterium sp. TaxID=1871053 RepID=UPI0035661FDB
MNLDPALTPLVGDMTAWRRRFHQHPELGFEEIETSHQVVRLLESWGVETHAGIAGTGVVGIIRGHSDGPGLGLRADMDALPIQEYGGRAHRSRRDGCMHACGHDGHTAMLLGAARVLSERRDFAGQVNLIFQPAEEGLGGAKAMIEDGLFERFGCDSIFALHNAPQLPLGSAAVHSGTACAGAATFRVVVRGQGGHAANPHLGSSAISAAASMVATLEAIPARRLHPAAMSVISVAAIDGGRAFNVIPDSVTLLGTARAFDAATLMAIETQMRQIVLGVGAAFSVTVDLEFQIIFSPTVNNVTEAAVAAAALEHVLGAGQVRRDLAPVTGSEDFAYMLERRPGAFVLLGAGVSDATPMLHAADYDFEDRLLPIGASFFLQMVDLKLRTAREAP